MENPILDFSATLAKPALVRVDDALRAHMAGAIAVRARLDAELVKPAPAPVRDGSASVRSPRCARPPARPVQIASSSTVL
jgi:hypothetical protein